MLSPDELRQKYLEFFKERGHEIIPSAPLVPENDPTTLFVGSGMQPLLPYLLGQSHPKGTRVVNSQKAFRSQDIEEAGDNRHTTYFEMLGNWSFGDYFKKEQLEWIYEFFTKICGLKPENLYVSVYEGNQKLGIPKDDEAAELWQQQGVPKERIYYYGDKKNWWSRVGEPANMPTGEPGGPDSEVFYDFGIDLGLHETSQWKEEDCHPNCDCGRFLEIGNNVFMAYVKTDKGYEVLKNKNIDFGGGFERILAAINDDPDVFKTGIFTPIIAYLENISGNTYGENEEITRSFRVIADHVRAAVMLAADGVFPSNKEQGYFARRLLRRAIRYGKMIGIEVEFLGGMVPVVAKLYQMSYPEVAQKTDQIKTAFVEEEQKFSETVKRGCDDLKRKWNQLATKGGWLPGAESAAQEAFNYYQTWGIPIDVYFDVAKEEFGGLTPLRVISLDYPNSDEMDEAEIRRLVTEEFEKLKQAHATQSRTASAGAFKGGLQDNSEIVVKYHTATHLLHAALHKILGKHAVQSGSNITADRLRFDFSHTQPMTELEIKEVESLMNDWIDQDLSVTREVLPKQEALDSGAIAFFIEKYPDEVSVYTIGHNADEDWISKEFCGGPHVTHTGEIGPIELFKEQSSGAGIRRIYARLRSSIT